MSAHHTPFVQVPEWVFLDSRLTDHALRVYLHVSAAAFRAGKRSMGRAALVRAVAVRSGSSRSAVYAALAILVEMGAITQRDGVWFLPHDTRSAGTDTGEYMSVQADESVHAHGLAPLYPENHTEDSKSLSNFTSDRSLRAPVDNGAP
jgi:hypothetical protein